MEIHGDLLADEQLQSPPGDGGKARQFGCDFVDAHAQRYPERTGAVGHGFEAVARCLIDRANHDPGQHAARGVGNGAADDCFLRDG